MLYNCILFLRGLFLFSSSGLLGYSSGSSGQQGIIKTYIDSILIYHEADISIFYLSQVCLKWSALIKFNRTSFALHLPAMLCQDLTRHSSSTNWLTSSLSKKSFTVKNSLMRTCLTIKIDRDSCKSTPLSVDKGSDTIINESINVPRRSIKGLLLFYEPRVVGTRVSEKTFDPDITEVKVIVKGIPNKGLEICGKGSSEDLERKTGRWMQ